MEQPRGNAPRGERVVEDEQLRQDTHAEGQTTGFGFCPRGTVQIGKRLTNTGRAEIERAFSKPATTFDLQETLAVFVAKSIGLQVQFNRQHETAPGTPHTNHHDDSTPVGLVYRFGQ